MDPVLIVTATGLVLMGIERLVSPDAPLGVTFEELFVAQMTGLARTKEKR